MKRTSYFSMFLVRSMNAESVRGQIMQSASVVTDLVTKRAATSTVTRCEPLGYVRPRRAGVLARGLHDVQSVSSKGVTLIEVMMAISVLAVAIVGLLTSIASAQRANLLFEEERIALDAATDKLEEIRGERFSSLSGRYGVGSPQLDFFDPRTGQTRAYNGAARTGGEESWFAIWMSGTNIGPYALPPPVDPNVNMSHPHGQIILVTSQNADENAFANPFPVDLDGRDSSGDGNGRNDNPAQIGFNPGTSGMLVAVVVRWRSAATGRNGEVALRTVVVQR